MTTASSAPGPSSGSIMGSVDRTAVALTAKLTATR
jgi:hypothetical protein